MTKDIIPYLVFAGSFVSGVAAVAGVAIVFGFGPTVTAFFAAVAGVSADVIAGVVQNSREAERCKDASLLNHYESK